MKSILLIILALFTFNVFAQSDDYLNVYIEPAWKERDKWQKPDEIIKRLKIDKSSTVADIGCHEGYMTFKLSETASKVLAVDVDQPKLSKMQKSIATKKITNIITIKGDYDDPKLPTDSLDAVVILDTYHEMDDHDKILLHIKNALKAGGRLVLCEPIADSRRKLARADQERKHELSMNYAIEDLQRAGFKIIEKTDPFVDRVKQKGDKMWLIVAVKQ
jgi:ubiquinone/menaquinone biosynthesis C-methylase UbiE